MASVQIEPEKKLALIIANAGGDVNKATYAAGNLIVPDVDQAALDAAVAAYNATYDPVAEANAEKKSVASLGLNTPFNAFLLDVLYDHESRIRANAGQPAITKNAFKQALLTLYISKL